MLLGAALLADVSVESGRGTARRSRFLAPVPAGFMGFSEFGLIAAAGVTTAMLAMVTVLLADSRLAMGLTARTASPGVWLDFRRLRRTVLVVLPQIGLAAAFLAAVIGLPALLQVGEERAERRARGTPA